MEFRMLSAAAGAALAAVLMGIPAGHAEDADACAREFAALEAVLALNDLQRQVLALQRHAADAVGGDSGAFDALEGSRESVDEAHGRLQQLKAPPGLDLLDFELGVVREITTELLDYATEILDRRDVILTSAETTPELRDRLAELESKAQSLGRALAEGDGSGMHVHQLGQVQVLAAGMPRHLGGLKNRGREAIDAADALGRGTVLMGRLIDGLLMGSEEPAIEPLDTDRAHRAMAEMSKLMRDVADLTDSLLDRTLETFTAMERAFDIRWQGDELVERTERLKKEIIGQ